MAKADTKLKKMAAVPEQDLFDGAERAQAVREARYQEMQREVQRLTAEAEASLQAADAARAARRAHSQPARGPVLMATASGVVATPEALADLAARATSYAEGARAKATRSAYQSDWRDFEGWCAAHARTALPAEPGTVGLYLAALADTRKPSTLTRRLAAVSVAHRLAGHHIDTRHPAIRDVLRGIRRDKGSAQRQAAALRTPDLRRMLDVGAERLIDRRNRALLLIGFGAALRRSEVVALDIADVTVAPEGLRIVIRRSKGDQEGEGQVVAIGRTGSPTCPVAAYLAWIAAAGLTEGAVFRSIDRHGRIGARLQPRAVLRIVRAQAERAGLDEPERYSGHSLRAGLATAAAAAGVEERAIMRITRHASVQTLRRYIREGGLFGRNVAAEVGL